MSSQQPQGTRQHQFTSDKAWHSLEISDALDTLKASDSGLMRQEAAARLEQYGPNQLPEPETRGPLLRFLYQFHNVLIYVLMAAGLTTALLGHWLDTTVIFGVVVINAIIGFIQEGKAEDALRAIRQMLSPQAIALRDGKHITIPATELVPGDIVLLQSGDKVPADLRLLRVKSLQIQEAALTGESMAVEKSIAPVKHESTLGDRPCMAYSGTLVTYGQGAGLVVETGAHTEIGQISQLVAEVEKVVTPLLRQIAQFGRWLTGAILLIASGTFAYGILVRDYSATDMFLAAVGLAVAAIPEGLPAIMTITLAIGVQRMAQRKAIIRRLPAVETLGAVNIICSDKTGTLTRNEMTVRAIATTDHLFELSGSGYDPHGAISLGGQEIAPDSHPVLQQMTRGAILCNQSTLEPSEGEWHVTGDPMEAALLVAGLKAGLDIKLESERYPDTDLIPFESEHRFMATLHHSHDGEAFVFLKGAPEEVLRMCERQRGITADQPLDCDYWLLHINSMAGQGQRVLAMAIKPVPAGQTELGFDDVQSGLIMLGLFGIIDPPRQEAIEAVSLCASAGIRVKMITGDHGETALAIAKQLKLVNAETVLTGEALEGMDEDTLSRQVLDVDVYARVSPEHKLRLVRQLQQHGLVTAMTGDGVNDAPALKRADVGTAMGHSGTEAAKEASDMVLVDDNFASISHAVEEGRTVYDNLKKAITFILPTNGGEGLIILAAIVLGFQNLPLTPVQILWVNMITAVTLALALAFEPPEPKVMQRPPRDSDAAILTPLLIWRIAFVSLVIMAGTFMLYLLDLQQGASIEHARTIAVNTLVMFEIFYLFNSRYLDASILSWQGLTGNRFVLIAIAVLLVFQLAFTYLGPLQKLFGTTAIELTNWGRIVLVASSILFLVELEKILVRKFLSGQNRSP